MADKILAHGITQEAKRQNALLRAMANHPELCFILVTILVTIVTNYGSSIKPKPVVIPAKTPQPLFPPVSHLLDLYLGDLGPLVDKLRHEDLIFVMYYAPWCVKSHLATTQFMKAAKFLEGQVSFVAVNCWYPEGMCRKQYKFLLYPVFFAYHKNNDGYRYMGIHRAEFMVKFLEDLLHPLTVLRTMDQVKNFVAEHDTVVVGHFDFNSSPQPPGFQQFYYAAMRVVEHDPYQPMKFAVVTDPQLAAQCHMGGPPDLVFVRINNATLKFPTLHNITASNIVRWVFAYRSQLPVRWVVPLGMKSLTLSKEIDKGPAVIMFHRVSPLSAASQTFSAFKDLALRYNQCPGDAMKQDYADRWKQVSIRNIIQHARVLNTCRDKKGGKLVSSPEVFKCCISTASGCQGCMPDKKLNVCEICHHRSGAQSDHPAACVFPDSGSPQFALTAGSISGSSRGSTASVDFLPSNSCLTSIENYDVSSRTSVCCKCSHKNISFTDFLQPPFMPGSVHGKAGGTRPPRRPTDRYVTDILEKLPRQLCSRLTFQKSQEAFPSAIIADFASSALPPEFTGQGCRQNRSLSFITLDAQNHWMFAESLGLNISEAHLSPVVVAFDKEREEHLVLKEKFSKKATASFILNFTKGLLERELRTVSSPRQQGCGSDPSTMCVTELTTETFHAFIDQPKDVVLLVYAHWCGFCASFSHVFLHLAHYFHTSPNITFARINGETNDLPWEFSMESYPTVIFFPAYREADSVAFPEDVSPTFPHLVRFVLQHATFATRLHLAADVCTPTCILENLDLARHTLRALRSKLRRLQSRLIDLRHESSNLQQPTTPAPSFSSSSSSSSSSNVPSSSSSSDTSAALTPTESLVAAVPQYHIALEKIMERRVEDIQKEIRDLRTLKEILHKVQEEGGGLDRKILEELLQDKLNWKGR